ncbi:MAG: pyridoxal 5'-phosphate synthase glutaminase subunit PdxT [Lachnospiraceae bacterium]|nr:pyridoxal 5'-phosphate synthase glutaminase subunit PdxT [Lachnospiraceae bacterium]
MHTSNKPVIGVFALQGAFIEHMRMLTALGATCYEIRQLTDLTARSYDGFVLPGGESTTQGKLLKALGLFAPLQERIRMGTPILATCAGAILLSNHIDNDSATHLKTLPATIHRNAYGRQLGSFATLAPCGNITDFPMVFIRAPYFTEVEDADVTVLARVAGAIVGVRYHNQLALSFHPELSGDTRIHQYFLNMMQSTES